MQQAVVRAVTLAVGLTLGLAACSDSGGGDSEDSPTTTGANSSSPASMPTAAPQGTVDAQGAGDSDSDTASGEGTVLPSEFDCDVSTTDTAAAGYQIENEIRMCAVDVLPKVVTVDRIVSGNGSIADFDVRDLEMSLAELNANGKTTLDSLAATYRCNPPAGEYGNHLVCEIWDNALKYYRGDLDLTVEVGIGSIDTVSPAR